ncbi:MAG: hypothetical protein O3A63_20085 [Proteobacteria bacterium]|nr:hypothetical protein [Pseudomonadota bacterium]
MRYLIKGVNSTKENRIDFEAELKRSSFQIDSVVLLPVVNGFTAEIELTSLGPFDEKSIEPYLQENLVSSSVETVFQKSAAEFDVVLQRLKF